MTVPPMIAMAWVRGGGASASAATATRHARSHMAPMLTDVHFIRRAEHPQDPWSGQMASPGGRAAPGDADLRATAIREPREEIGVDLPAAAEPLGGLDEVRAMARLRPMNLTITPFVFRLHESL